MDIYEYATREFERLYDCTMAVQLYKQVSNQDDDDPFADNDPFTTSEWVNQLENIPCRIAKKSLNIVKQDGVAATAGIAIYIYCNPKYEVPPGSRIVVTNRHGQTETYERSSEPFDAYATHQEIAVERVTNA